MLAVLMLWLAAGLLVAQETKGEAAPQPFPGLKLAPVPEELRAHLPVLADAGLLVVEALKGSPGYQAGFRRHDVLLRAAGQPIRADGRWLADLAKTKAGKVEVALLRGGKEQVLAIAFPLPEGANEPRGYLKPDGPPAVSVQAQPMPGGQFNVTILFYGDNSAKLTKLTCTGSIPEIQQQVQGHAEEQRLPERIRDLVVVAIDRLRAIKAAGDGK